MNSNKTITFWKAVRGSYWFIPTLMSIAAVGFSFLMPFIDGILAEEGRTLPFWLYGGGVEGARSVLSTIAGSMITVASLTFSITLVALSAAAQQYGPRLLAHFMSDTGYQIVLGTFVANFLYSLLVLRQVQDTGGDSVIPRLAVSFAVLLAIVALALLIYFIHHATASLRPENLVKRIGRDLREAVDTDTRQEGREGRSREEEEDAAGWGHTLLIGSPRSGYLQGIDKRPLDRTARDKHLSMRAVRRPGEFIARGSALVEVESSQAVTGETTDEILKGLPVDSDSGPKSDVETAISQLVEVAVRALSPSINNPATALACIDQLEGALVRVAARECGRGVDPRESADGNRSRLRLAPLTFADLVGPAFGQIRHNGRGTPVIVLRLMRAFVALSDRVCERASLEALLQETALTARAGEELPELQDRLSVARLHSLVLSRGPSLGNRTPTAPA